MFTPATKVGNMVDLYSLKIILFLGSVWASTFVVWWVIYKERQNEFTRVSNGLALAWMVYCLIPIFNLIVAVFLIFTFSDHFTTIETFKNWLGRTVYERPNALVYPDDDKGDGTGPFF